MKNIGVVGSGSFGTALSVVLANKGYRVTITGRNKEILEEIQNEKKNQKYLPDILLPSNIETSNSLEETVKDKDLVLFSVPAQTFGKVLSDCYSFLKDDQLIVNVAKGIEIESLLRLSEVAKNIKHNLRYVSLSGPSHAEEVALSLPTTVTVSSQNLKDAEEVQEIFGTSRFRVYTNEDLIGLELGGALKNIMAVGAGISDGLGFGDNAKAALMTRGMAEITRLGVAMGAKESTFLGLSGMGDLIVTCTSMHSRNRRCGILIGQGMNLKEAVSSIGMVVEGVYTCQAASKLAIKYNVEMPITQVLSDVISGKLTAKESIEILMNRTPKDEGIEVYL